MRELEESLGMLFPEGYKNIEVLREIASDIAKLEVGNLWMRGKSPLYKSSLIADTTGSDQKLEQLGPIAQHVAEFRRSGPQFNSPRQQQSNRHDYGGSQGRDYN